MRYLYDESNNPVGFGMQYPTETKWENYYFAKNVQGDIVAIYRYDYNASTQKPYGTLIATYEYDPWGNPQGIKDASGKAIAQTANHVATYNPFRYRGYRYDGDTGLYYLQSRYYDPMTCRFVNADTYASTGQGIVGYNMFSYCNNDSLNFFDKNGRSRESALSLKSDWAGRSILFHWLYGYGTDYIVTEGRWGEYMRNNVRLTSIINKIANEKGVNLVVGKIITVDVTTSAVIENGENITGYNYLHGTNSDVGGFHLAGVIWRGKSGDICYDLNCTWNDIIDPNPVYSTDRMKANLAKFIPYANRTDYYISITWRASNRFAKPGRGGKPRQSVVLAEM